MQYKNVFKDYGFRYEGIKGRHTYYKKRYDCATLYAILTRTSTKNDKLSFGMQVDDGYADSEKLKSIKYLMRVEKTVTEKMKALGFKII